MIKKIYIPRCARAGCTETGIHRVDSQVQQRIPAHVLEGIPHDDEIWCCSWCRFVWHQPRCGRPGVEASALGYLDSGSKDFIENHLVPTRDWSRNFERIPSQPPGRRNRGRGDRR